MARSADEIYDRLGDLIDAINNGGLATGGSTGVARGSISRGYSASFGRRDDNEYNVKKNKAILGFDPDKGETEKYLELLDLQDELNEKAEGAREELEALNELRKEGVELTEEQLEREKELQDVLQEQNNVKAQLNNRSFFGSIGRDFNNLISSVKQFVSTAKEFIDPWVKMDEAASKYAKTVGMTSTAMARLRTQTINNMADNKLAAKYGLKSIDELLVAQENYVKASGRNIRVSNSDQDYIGAINNMTGAKGLDLAAALDNFGVGVGKTSDMLGRMFSDASKQGISFEKYSDNVAKNIKLAQNYTFKNGIKGLENMAKKATTMKMDMQQVAALADKVSTVEGAIDVSSKLQVLGGPFAQLADPLGMLNEGLNDMEGLQDRLIKMVGNMGSFNKKTGEVEVSSFNKQRIKAAASAMGVSYDSLMESANAQARRGEIGKQIETSANAKGLSEDMKELIKNSGTFKDGKAGVSIGGKFKTLDQITEADKEALQRESNTESQDLRIIAEGMLGTQSILDGIKTQNEAFRAQLIDNTFGSEFKDILKGLSRNDWLYKMLLAISIAAGANAALNVGKAVFKTAKNVVNAGKKVYSRIKNGKVGKTASKIATKAKNAVKNTVSKATRGTTNAVRNSAGRWIDPKTGRYVSTNSVSSGSRLSNFASKVSNGARNAFNTTKSGLSRGFTAAKSGLSRGFTAAKSGISSAWNVAKTKGGSLLKTAKGGLSKLTSKFGGTALKAVAKTGLKSAAKIGGKLALGMAKGGPLGIVGAIGDVATDALVASGKIKKGGVAHNMLSAGSGAASGAAMGAMIGSVIPGVGTLIGGAVGAVVGGIKGLWKAGGLQKIGKGIKNAAGKAWKGVRNFTKNVGKRIKNSKIGKAVGSAINKVKNSKVGKAVGSAINKVKNSKIGKAVGSVARGIGNFIGGIFGKKKPRQKTQAEIEAERREAQMQKLRAKTADSSKDVLAKYKQNIKPIPEKGTSSTYGGVDKANKDIKIKTDPHDVNINGTLSIKGENGQTINIVDELKRNPDMLRSVTSMISNEMGVIERGANIQYA